MITGSVQDNGIGIGPEALPHIWERFYQADTSRKDQGSGLGLSMVKWIVEAHGGTIWLRASRGEEQNLNFLFQKKYKKFYLFNLALMFALYNELNKAKQTKETR